MVNGLRVSLETHAKELGWLAQVSGAMYRSGAVQLIDAGTAPENFSGVIRQHTPEVVLFIDAASMGLPAGSVRLVDAGMAEGFGASSHVQPLATLAQYLENSLGCSAYLLAIEPGQVGFEQGLSVPVEHACQTVIDWLRAFLLNNLSNNAA